MYELKKLNLKQSEKYMTYKCNEYGKHYKKYHSRCGRPFRFNKTSKNPHDDKDNGSNDGSYAGNPAPRAAIIFFRSPVVNCGIGAQGTAVPDREVLLLSQCDSTNQCNRQAENQDANWHGEETERIRALRTGVGDKRNDQRQH